jgi:hypothetical protein
MSGPSSANAAMSLLNSFLIVLTLAAVVAAFVQVALTNRTARRQLRAYVFLDAGEVTWNPADKTASFIARFRNGGQTPAFNYQCGVEFVIAEPTFKGYWQVRDMVAGRTITTFGHGGCHEVPGAPIPLSEQDLPRWLAGEKDLFVFSRVEYDDVFGRRHKLCNRFRVKAPGDQTALPLIHDDI